MAKLSAPYPWLEKVWDDLVRRVDSGRLPHAILFAGPPGWGQWELALALARRILGLDESGSPQALAHPDFRSLTVEEGRRQILVDQVRALNEFAFETASAGGAKVAVIYPAEALNQNAANALLKTLEEPSRDTHLLLASHAAGRLLPTITSRCQRITLGAAQQEPARDWVAERIGRGEKSEAALFFAGGAPLDALALIEEGSLADAQKLERSLMDRGAEAASVARVADTRPLDQVLDWWLRIAVRWQRSHPRSRESFEFMDALLQSKAQSLAVVLNPPLVIQSLHRRWCELVHKPEHSN